MCVEDDKYYQYVRTELIEHIPLGEHRILEVGCAEGYTSEALKNKGCAIETVGIEYLPEAANLAKDKLDHVVCGDLEKLTLNKPWFVEDSFDYIICGDVLEHLVDPWTQLKRLMTFLKPGGIIIVSLPNIRYYGVTLPLIFSDEWEYKESGILDSTHLRFFTRKTALKLLIDTGLNSVNCLPLIHRRRDKIISLCSLGLLTGLVSYQWILTGKKPL